MHDESAVLANLLPIEKISLETLILTTLAAPMAPMAMQSPTSLLNFVSAQAKRLDELEKLYKDEQVQRKRLHNLMEDMKGKIRVYCRVRPMLQFEREKGQQFALRIPDELTIVHMWKDLKIPKEYGFDRCGGGKKRKAVVYEWRR